MIPMSATFMLIFLLFFVIFVSAISLTILMVMKLIFVTKHQLRNEMAIFKIDIINNLTGKFDKFTEDMQKFITIAMNEKISDISRQMSAIMSKLKDIEDQINKRTIN